MSDLLKLRKALFDELEKLNGEELKGNKEKLQDAINHANAVAKVCDTLIDSAKLEHNFMRMSERILPFTDFMGQGAESRIYSAEYYARLAVEKRSSAAPRIIGKLDQHTGET